MGYKIILHPWESFMADGVAATLAKMPAVNDDQRVVTKEEIECLFTYTGASI